MRVRYYAPEEALYALITVWGSNINQMRQFLYHYFLIIVHVISSRKYRGFNEVNHLNICKFNQRRLCGLSLQDSLHVLVCVRVCMLEGDHLTFDYLAEHSLTWWLTHCFAVTTALITQRLIVGVTQILAAWHTEAHTPLQICTTEKTNFVWYMAFTSQQVTAVSSLWRRGIVVKSLSRLIISRARTQCDDFKVECLQTVECFYESSEWRVSDTEVSESSPSSLHRQLRPFLFPLFSPPATTSLLNVSTWLHPFIFIEAALNINHRQPAPHIVDQMDSWLYLLYLFTLPKILRHSQSNPKIRILIWIRKTSRLQAAMRFPMSQHNPEGPNSIL